MAEIEKAVLDHIAAGSTLAASRVLPEFKKVNQTYPAVTVRLVSGPVELNLDGASDLRESRFEIDCWAATYKQVSQLAREVSVLFDGLSGLIGSGSPQVRIHSARTENVTDLSSISGDRKDRRKAVDVIVMYEV